MSSTPTGPATDSTSGHGTDDGAGPDQAEHWRRLAEQRASELDVLRAQIDALRVDLDALRAGETGAAAADEQRAPETAYVSGPSDGNQPPQRQAKAPEMAGRIGVWVATVIAMSVVGRVLGYDKDPLAALWFLTVAAVVTVAMVMLARKR